MVFGTRDAGLYVVVAAFVLFFVFSAFGSGVGAFQWVKEHSKAEPPPKRLGSTLTRPR
jgi:hypothetical protein